MKVIVQIPCFNEEATLARTVADIPRRIDGVDQVEVLVIDDGSTDRTVEVARASGVDHIARHTANRGLARAFRTGLDACLRLGADIIVNIDADNEHDSREIPKLIRPILEGKADIVVGDRRTQEVQHFSASKKRLQALGSFVVRTLSGTDVPDTVCGFRALSREAALRMNIVSGFSYTIEMLIQAGRERMAITSVPISTQKSPRASRLMKSLPQFISRSVTTMVRAYAMYNPLRVFFYIGLGLSIIGLLPVIRFFYLVLIGEAGAHLQSLILSGVFLIIGFVTFLIGLVADLIGFNRQLLETALEKIRRLELKEGTAADLEKQRPAAGTGRRSTP